jgi:hypothetical protein
MKTGTLSQLSPYSEELFRGCKGNKAKEKWEIMSTSKSSILKGGCRIPFGKEPPLSRKVS